MHALQVRYDAELAALRSGVERVVVELVVGPKSTAASRKAILPHMDDLAAFLGRRSWSPCRLLDIPAVPVRMKASCMWLPSSFLCTLKIEYWLCIKHIHVHTVECDGSKLQSSSGVHTCLDIKISSWCSQSLAQQPSLAESPLA